MVRLIAVAGLSALIFAGLKFLFWINAAIFLRLMERSVPGSYWKWTPTEVVLASAAAVTFSAEIVFRTESVLLPLTFTASSLAWLGYMSRRVWLISGPR